MLSDGILMMTLSRYGVVSISRGSFYIGLLNNRQEVPLPRLKTNGLTDVSWNAVTIDATHMTVWTQATDGRRIAKTSFGSVISATSGTFTVVMPPQGLISFDKP